jgi:lipoprotein-anchoring transpeptidase ErfK/SrfK
MFCGAFFFVTKRAPQKGTVPGVPVVSEDVAPKEQKPVSRDEPLTLETEPAPDGSESGGVKRAKTKKGSGTLIVIEKNSHTLEVFRDGKRVKKYGVAVGKNTGDKQRVGDMRTPEGEFPIVQIQNASKWSHDFRDGKGEVKGAYGPYFIRLGTPGWSGIGIHGTHAPDSIGRDVTEGCIRLNNDDVAELRKMVKIGDRVIIKR